MRLFYASFLGSENMDSYESLVAGLIAEVPNALRSIPSHTHHLTLAFLGEIVDDDVEQCLQILEIAKSVSAFRFSLKHPTILYSRRSPRLVCAGLDDGGEQVSELQRQLHVEFLRRFPASEVRIKPPHVTLARFKKKATRETARKVAESLAHREDPARNRTDVLARIALVKSVLTPSGPIYESLGESALSGAESLARLQPTRTPTDLGFAKK